MALEGSFTAKTTSPLSEGVVMFILISYCIYKVSTLSLSIILRVEV